MPARVLVVGAGIAGLATAVALRRAGIEVSVIEQRTDANSGSGISIWPNALAALDEIALGDVVRDAGGRVTAGAIRWRDGAWLRRPSAQRALAVALTGVGESRGPHWRCIVFPDLIVYSIIGHVFVHFALLT